MILQQDIAHESKNGTAVIPQEARCEQQEAVAHGELTTTVLT